MADARLAAIARWGAELRLARVRRRRVLRYGLALCLFGVALAMTITRPPRPWLVWNVSASAPIGLYAVGQARSLARGDMVIARLPPGWRRFAARRHYLPANVPLVKRVVALPGDLVCARRRILVNDIRVAWQRTTDGAGRFMPGWSGCRRLVDGAHLLLMDDPDSFDGRYFGPTNSDDIIGKAFLLWRT